MAQVLVIVLPYLEYFDLRSATVTGKIASFGNELGAYSYAAIWGTTVRRSERW